MSFFASPVDMAVLLEKIESQVDLQFTLIGLFDSPIFNSIPSSTLIFRLENLLSGDINHTPRYLTTTIGTPVQMRHVPQKNGDVKYAIDQLANPGSITLQPGGVFKKSYLIAGQMGTVSNIPASLGLYQIFSKEMKYQFRKINSYFVGREAENLLDNGWRLTTNPNKPSIYDLSRE